MHKAKVLDFFIGEHGIYNHINSGLLRISQKNKNIFLFNAFEVMCPTSTCSHYENGSALYFDTNHLTSFSTKKRIYPVLKDFIKNKIL